MPNMASWSAGISAPLHSAQVVVRTPRSTTPSRASQPVHILERSSSLERSCSGVRIGELGEEPFPIVELSARFTIESITAVVTGSKTTVPGGAATFVICQFCGLGTCPAFINSAGFESAAELDYAATIHGDGTHSDRGTSLMEIVSFSGGQTFDENFISALAQISPGRSPGLQPGRGCGDRNHVHDRSVDCP